MTEKDVLWFPTRLLNIWGLWNNNKNARTHTHTLTVKIEVFAQLFCTDHPAIVWLALTGQTDVTSWVYALSAIVLIELTPSFISCRYSHPKYIYRYNLHISEMKSNIQNKLFTKSNTSVK